jgi:aldose 1-epimerase
MKYGSVILGLGAAILATSGAAQGKSGQAGTATREDGGQLKDGTKVEAVVLDNGRGVSARILAYGATLQQLIAPDRRGRKADILLGHDSVGAYEATQDYLGVTVGRYANRIAGGKFTLDGTAYQLPINNGVNSLHGGGHGFDRKLWQVVAVKSGAQPSVSLRLVSPDGADGYPGEVTATTTYTLDIKGRLTIVFDANTNKPTILNMTNHALFNLAGTCAPQGAMGHRLTMPASHYLPVDATLIPTGEVRSVAGTVFDFRKGRVLGTALRDGHDAQIAIGRGYDHNWVLDKGLTKQPELAARVDDPASGRVLQVYSTEPGLQIYTGNFLDGSNLGKGGCVYRMGDGLALEPQKFPDSPNKKAFISPRVDPDTPYRHVMIYALSVKK